jgi:hypothetical protein
MVATVKLSILIKQLNNSLVALGDVEVEIQRSLDGNSYRNAEKISGVSNDGDKVQILSDRSSGLGGF